MLVSVVHFLHLNFSPAAHKGKNISNTILLTGFKLTQKILMLRTAKLENIPSPHPGFSLPGYLHPHYTALSLLSTNWTICLRAWEMTGVRGTMGVPGVVAPGVEVAGVEATGVEATGDEATGVDPAGVEALGVPPGVAPGVVPGVAGMTTTGDGPGLSARGSNRGVDVTKRASLIR